ncbi:hypothetical protein ES703_84357 [subsurface metagenome]
MTDFWKKVGKVAGIVIGLAGFVAMVASIFRGGRPASRSRPGSAAGGGVWFVGTGQTKKPGSWSSGRHR